MRSVVSEAHFDQWRVHFTFNYYFLSVNYICFVCKPKEYLKFYSLSYRTLVWLSQIEKFPLVRPDNVYISEGLIFCLPLIMIPYQIKY